MNFQCLSGGSQIPRALVRTQCPKYLGSSVSVIESSTCALVSMILEQKRDCWQSKRTNVTRKEAPNPGEGSNQRVTGNEREMKGWSNCEGISVVFTNISKGTAFPHQGVRRNNLWIMGRYNLNEKFVCNMIQQKCDTVKMKIDNLGREHTVIKELDKYESMTWYERAKWKKIP